MIRIEYLLEKRYFGGMEFSVIRPYHINDKKELVAIFMRNTPKYFDPKESRDFETYLQEFKNTYLTVLYQNKIVGGAGYYAMESDNSGRVTWIFFHPDYTGLGLGKKVMDHCLERLNANPIVRKLVVTTSQLAYTFFEKFGYQLVRSEKDHWGPGLDLYVMERSVIQS